MNKLFCNKNNIKNTTSIIVFTYTVEVKNLLLSGIMHCNWLKQVMRLTATNRIALFQTKRNKGIKDFMVSFKVDFTFKFSLLIESSKF